jgi:hypothetical protein
VNRQSGGTAGRGVSLARPTTRSTEPRVVKINAGLKDVSSPSANSEISLSINLPRGMKKQQVLLESDLLVICNFGSGSDHEVRCRLGCPTADAS